MAFEGRRAGVTGRYRFQKNTATNEGSHGGRVSIRAGWSGVLATAFLDDQKDTATVALVFRETPELAQLFTELGLTIRTPDDVTRFLRDEATFAAVAYIEDISVSLEPFRWLAGGSLVWASPRDTWARGYASTGCRLCLPSAAAARLEDRSFATIREAASARAAGPPFPVPA